MRWLNRQSGDTLVEVAMAIAILGVVLVTAFNVANQTLRVGMQARERTEASHLAQNQAEQFRAWRQQLAKKSPPEFFGSAAGNIGACTGSSGSCMVVWDGARYVVQTCGGGCPAPSNQLYKLKTTARNFNVGSGEYYRFTIDVDWDSAVGGDPNKTEVVLDLAKTVGLQPIECTGREQACR
jgi:prepilin-type N-terminal cleavage/methylation domain-containing protein